MVSHIVAALCGVLFVASAMVESKFIDTEIPMPKIGSVSPLAPSLDDVRMCMGNAKGRSLRLCLKIPLDTCNPMCMFSNGEEYEMEQVKAVDGQLCCDMVGVGPTGLCKNGTCMLGGVADVSAKTGMNKVKSFFPGK